MQEGASLAKDSQSVSAQTRSMTDEAYRRLEELIVTLELAPGLMISENQLAEKLSLGRTPVREAVQRLAAEGLVEIMPRRGLRIAPIDLRKQVRLLETRRVLESLVARSAATRASTAQRQKLLAISQAFLDQGSTHYPTFLQLDLAFNAAVAEACDNEFAVAALEGLHGLSRRFWHYYSGHDEDLPSVARIHADIARAISTGDTAAVETSVRSHMDYIQSFTSSILQMAAP